MLSEERLLIERLEELLFVHGRYVDTAFQFRIWRRFGQGKNDFKGEELLQTVYGGRYDRLLRTYVPADEETGGPLNVAEVACHEGQLPLLLHSNNAHLHVVALGAPGAGKTFAAVRRALRNALDRPNSIGGMVGPTNDRRWILWRDFLELADPLGYVKEVRQTKKEIILWNGTVIQVLAAGKPSRTKGNPIQGRSWDWCVVDEAQNVDDEAMAEIATRGRRAGSEYRMYETCTNSAQPEFRMRLERYKDDPQATIVKFKGPQNPFVDPKWWERMRGDLSERDYRQLIDVEELAPESLVYNQFSYKDNLRPVPGPHDPDWVDVTKVVTLEAYQEPYSWIVGQDFGVLCNASVLLKAFKPRTPFGFDKEAPITWWAVDEITSWEQTAAVHAVMLLDRYPNVDDLVVVADPHFNTKEADRSDYHQFREAKLKIVPSAHGKIPVKHRVTMVNSLMKDAQGKRHLFIACDSSRRTNCNKLAAALMGLQYDHTGRPQPPRKDRKDQTHWPDALGYGLFPFEKLRGGPLRIV